VMFWVNQRYWQESGVPLAYFGVLLAGYGLIAGLAGRAAPLGATRYGRRPLLAAAGALPIIAYFAMASFLGWTGIVLGILARWAGAWARCSSWRRSTRGSPPRSARP
jgi:hypothetical protein